MGNSKQALQDMLRARHPDPQFNNSGGGNSNFMPAPGRTSYPMRPSMPNRMPQTTMYGSGGNNGPPQYSNNSSGGQGGQNYGNFQGQQSNQYPYNMMQQNQNQGQRPPPPGNFNQMGPMRPQGGQQGGYMGGFPPQSNQFRPQMNMNQNQQNMMRMQNPQLMAQLQRGPGNMNQQGQMGYQGQNRF